MFGVNTNYKVKHKSAIWIEPVLAQWLRINRDYIEEMGCLDSLYWYNERANVSALAGAMWKCGGFAIEEYSSIKGGDETVQKNGRVDLYLYNHGNEAICEAKMNWIFLCERQRRSFSDTLSNAMQVSMDELNKTLEPFTDAFGIALNFIATYSKDGENVSDSLENLRYAVENSKCSFYAWFENTSGKYIVSSGRHICNFVALIGTVREKG